MAKAYASPLPTQALLHRYKKDGYYTDCYVTDIPASMSHEQFVVAFYTTALFKLERIILKLAVSRPSTDEQVVALAKGQAQKFAAWTVEDRATEQLLLCDFRGRTRSWLMIADIDEEESSGTRLYFGSAVVPVRNRSTGKSTLGLPVRLLLGFHKLYSIALLSMAAAKLTRGRLS